MPPRQLDPRRLFPRCLIRIQSCVWKRRRPRGRFPQHSESVLNGDHQGAGRKYSWARIGFVGYQRNRRPSAWSCQTSSANRTVDRIPRRDWKLQALQILPARRHLNSGCALPCCLGPVPPLACSPGLGADFQDWVVLGLRRRQGVGSPNYRSRPESLQARRPKQMWASRNRNRSSRCRRPRDGNRRRTRRCWCQCIVVSNVL